MHFKNPILFGIIIYLNLSIVHAQAVMTDYMHRRFFDANNIRMPIYNTGQFARDSIRNHGHGLEWPTGEETYAVYQSGPWVIAKVNGEKRIALADYAGKHFYPGPIINGTPADPYDSTYRVYKITPEDLTNPGIDYLEWPFDLGAPADSSGNPRLVGDQTLWTIFNNADTTTHPKFGFNNPLGLEVHLTVFGWDMDSLEDVVFLQYKYINKSDHLWDSTFFSMECDFDLGYAGDDLGGTDSLLNLVFGYNAWESDSEYGTPPPAIGYVLLDGVGIPELPIMYSSFVRIHNLPHYHYPQNIDQIWYLVNGLTMLGTPYVTLLDFDTVYTQYAFPGDPVTQEGWVDDSIMVTDRTFWVTPQPISMEPGETVELTFAIVLVRGDDRLDSVTKLKEKVVYVRQFYENGFLSTIHGQEPQLLPNRLILYPNYPNPFNPITNINYALPEDSFVELMIYNLLGQEVRKLPTGNEPAGIRSIVWDGRDNRGRMTSSGVYIYRLSAKSVESGEHFHQARKMLLLR
ncbi:MAG: T9SS type A sorting domain-containing protein [Candidatus Marinimicrobia bacterium]|nr:T9SS type A sorting domain-containing protein [Candidatus Neomarinimicrobiota bacterium]